MHHVEKHLVSLNRLNISSLTFLKLRIMPKIKCAFCEKEFYRSPSSLKVINYCSLKCYSASVPRLTRACETCGKEVTRIASGMLSHTFCSRRCSSKYLSEKMTAMNISLNPSRMIPATREKLRNFQLLPPDERVSYAKYYGRHLHRVIAEAVLGRTLEIGEVVHHIDNNKQNNSPDNLRVFSSQAEHAAHHRRQKYVKRK